MRRLLLGQQAASVARLEPATGRKTATTTGPQLAYRLRQRRSPRYLQAVARLDAGRHLGDRAALDQLLEAIAAEFPDLTLDQRPLGLVSVCHLGEPYEVHICDFSGDILDHYKRGQAMPPLYERARRLATHPSYMFIEVYPDALRAVTATGTVAVNE